MRKKLKIYLIASFLALSGCKDKCSNNDLLQPYGYLSIKYINSNTGKPYYPVNSFTTKLPDELIGLKIVNENNNNIPFSIPLINNSYYQIQIDNFVGVSGMVEEKTYDNLFIIQFNNRDIDSLKTQTVIEKADCGYLTIKDFTAKYKQKAIKSSNSNLANNVEITITK
jgi:hypothetical protein